jgi:hypothetical protein
MANHSLHVEARIRPELRKAKSHEGSECFKRNHIRYELASVARDLRDLIEKSMYTSSRFHIPPHQSTLPLTVCTVVSSMGLRQIVSTNMAAYQGLSFVFFAPLAFLVITVFVSRPVQRESCQQFVGH